MTRNSITLVGLAIVAALFAIAGSIASIFWLTLFFKPLATLLLICTAFGNAARTRLPYAGWICIGLFFSLIGDIFLIWPDKFFLFGLAAFLLAHIAYIIAFTRDAKFPAYVSVWLAFLALAAANVYLLRPNLPTGLTLPVALYATLLATMTAQALGRSLLLRTSSAALAAIGAIFFLLSDSLLAWDRFRTALLFAPALILIPYYLAQFLIALSTSPAPPGPADPA